MNNNIEFFLWDAEDFYSKNRNAMIYWFIEQHFTGFNKGEQPDVYFDEELYKNRFKIEQANGWLDGYKGLIMRYEYLDVTWIGMLLLGFISKFLKKV